MRILIAEDDAVSRRLLRGHLERWGHQVTESTDGQEAWDLLVKAEAEGAPFPIIVADWMMPGVDGLELIQRVRHRHFPRYTYIIMLTAKNEKSDVVHGMDAGADDYLTKPFDKDELRARLQAGIRILSLQAALTQSEKNASVGRLAVGVAAEMAGPVNEVIDALRELRQDLHHVAEAMSPAGVGAGENGGHGGHLEQDGPPRVVTAPPDLDHIRATMGPKFMTAEGKLSRVRDLVRSLRDFARVDELPTKTVSVAPLITDTLSMMRSELASRSLRVDWQPSDNLPPISANPGKIKRAIYNLLSVLSETESVGGTLTVLARSEPVGVGAGITGLTHPATSPNGGAGGSVVVDLCSSSSGIPLEQLPHLFEPFAADVSGAGTTGGAGLGLPIAFSILREHGGTLEASPHLGGTRFRVRLPRAA